MSTETAEAQATYLENLVLHLNENPQLAPVNILSADRLQLRVPRRDAATALADWAETIGAETVALHLINCEYGDDPGPAVFAYARGSLGELDTEVWDMIPGLAEAMGSEVFGTSGHVTATVDALRAWSQDGTAPTPIDSLEG